MSIVRAPIGSQEECDALIDLINTMLDITEVEAGVHEARIEEFDLSALGDEACELFRPIAVEWTGSGISETDLPYPFKVKSQPNRGSTFTLCFEA